MLCNAIRSGFRSSLPIPVGCTKLSSTRSMRTCSRTVLISNTERSTEIPVNGMMSIDSTKTLSGLNHAGSKKSHGNEFSVASFGGAFRNKSIYDLYLAWLVYKVSAIKPLVNAAPCILQFSERIHISSVPYAILRRTFFKHFCGGETAAQVVPLMVSLEKQHIGAILDLAIEADQGSSPTTEDIDEVERLFESCIDTASQSQDAFACLKVTALMPPDDLYRLSKAFDLLSRIFASCSLTLHDNPYCIQLLKGNLVPLQVDTMKTTPNTEISQMIKQYNDMILHPNSLKEFKNALHRLDRLCVRAVAQKVTLLIDAEQSYFQHAIDVFALAMLIKHNIKRANIFNTYQMYLREGEKKLQSHMQLLDSLKVPLGAKIVRGAYMQSEREKARKENYPDPIHSQKEDTDKSYHAAVVRAIEAISKDNSVRILFATHNADSMIDVVNQLNQYGISPEQRQRQVYFGQLLGMGDHLTCALANQGYRAMKYVPYGPIRDVIPYLIRRALENSDMLSSTYQDRIYVKKEIQQRISSFCSRREKSDVSS